MKIMVETEVTLEEYKGRDVWEDGKQRWIVTNIDIYDLPSIDEIILDDEVWLYGEEVSDG